ncbi:MAG: RIP metalloprotease RseP [Eubacterium sp.]|nr:RIP metalloprotease RseP [Eubacterium sp.]
MQTFISIVIALIIFSLLVIFHEFGHFIVARKCGVTVNEFSVGMGPRIVSHVAKSGTRYSLKALPFGGSCAMLGEDEDNAEEGSFNSKPLWARMAIVFAGPFFNFILAFLMALLFVGFNGTDPAYVVQVKEGSAAEKAGLQKGDRITGFNGESISIGREIYLEEFINPIGEKDTVQLTVKRNGKTKKFTYKPDSEKKPMLGITYSGGENPVMIQSVVENSAMKKAGALPGDTIVEMNGEEIKTGKQFMETMASYQGKDFETTDFEIVLDRNGKKIPVKVKPEVSRIYDIGFYYNMHGEKQSAAGVVKYSLVETKYVIKVVVKGLKKLVTGQVSADEISGPVGIVDSIGDTYTSTKKMGASVTFFSLLSLAIMLSANLGVMNLLPIPALDGGRLLLYLVELVIRKPIPKDKEGMIHFVGFILLMGLMVFLIFNDVRKIFF